MIAALESNSRNYSNWIELDKIFTSRLRRVFARGAKCKDDASLFVENHRVKLSVVPPSPTLRCLLFLPSSSSSILCIRPHPCNWNVYFHETSPAYERVSRVHRFIFKNVKTTSLSTVSLLLLLSFPSLVISSSFSSGIRVSFFRSFSLRVGYLPLERRARMALLLITRLPFYSLTLYNSKKFSSNIRNCEWKEIVEIR